MAISHHYCLILVDPGAAEANLSSTAIVRRGRAERKLAELVYQRCGNPGIVDTGRANRWPRRRPVMGRPH